MTHKDMAAKLRTVADLLEGLPDDVPGPFVAAFAGGDVTAHWQDASPGTAALVVGALPGDWRDWREITYRHGVERTYCGVGLAVMIGAETCSCGAPCDHDGGAA